MTDRRVIKVVGQTRMKGLTAICVVVAALLAAITISVPGSSAQTDGEMVEGRFRLRGTTGSEEIRFSWSGGSPMNGASPVDTWIEITVPVPVTARWIRVNFVNDGLTDAGLDRNLIVDWFEIEGVRIETESDDVFSEGVYNGNDCSGGYRNSEFLACNGYFEFPVGDILDPRPDDPTLVEFDVTGSTGTEDLRVFVNGEDLGRAIVRDTERSTFTIPWWSTETIETVRIAFINDGIDSLRGDRNVFFHSITVDNKAYDPRTLESLGTWNGVDCAQGFRNSNWLNCAGWFEVIHDSSPPPPPPPDGETLTIRAQGVTGKELLAVTARGETLTEIRLSTITSEYPVELPQVDAETLRVEFVNDAIDSLGDRNVYIDWIEFRGVTHDTEELRSKGSWNGTDCGEGFRNSNWLHCNGWFEVPLG